MTRTAPGWSMLRRRVAGQRGATLVELAFVSVFLVSIIAGTYDFGQAWRTGLAVNEAARTGARVGSAQGPVREADFNALSGAKAALVSSGRLDRVLRVVVFRSTAADGKMPAACKTAATTDCQVIPGAAFQTNWEASAYTSVTTATGCLTIATAQNWCPTTRDNVQTSAEYYGIWIQVRHPYEFPLLGSGTDIERTVTMRLEPKAE